MAKVGVGSHGGGKTHTHTHTYKFPEEVVDDRRAQGSRQVSPAFNLAKIRVGGRRGVAMVATRTQPFPQCLRTVEST